MKAKTIACIIWIILIIYSSIGWWQGHHTLKQCKDICNEKDAIAFERIQNDEYNLKDHCMCYYEDSQELIPLNQGVI